MQLYVFVICSHTLMCPHSICLSLQKIPTTKVYTFALQPQAKSYNSSFDAASFQYHTLCFSQRLENCHTLPFARMSIAKMESPKTFCLTQRVGDFGRAFAAMFSLPKKKAPKGEKKQMPKMPSWNISMIGAMSNSVQAQPCSCTFSSISITIYHHIATMSV